MCSKFTQTKDQLREYNRRAGKKTAARQKLDKAFGWTKRTEVRTRLSPEAPLRKPIE